MLMFKCYTSMLDDAFLVMYDAHFYSTRDVFIKMKYGYRYRFHNVTDI